MSGAMPHSILHFQDSPRPIGLKKPNAKLSPNVWHMLIAYFFSLANIGGGAGINWTADAISPLRVRVPGMILGLCQHS